MPDSHDAPRRASAPVVAGSVVAGVLLALCGLVGGILIALTLLGPAIGNVFSSVIVVQECAFGLTVVAFEDIDGDGLRAADEPPLEDVSVHLAMDQQQDADTAVTDAEGIAKVEWSHPACQTARTFAVTVDSPPGYRATTATSYGPQETTFYLYPPPLYAGFAKTP